MHIRFFDSIVTLGLFVILKKSSQAATYDECVDSPKDWRANGIDCSWFASGNNCQRYGGYYESMGVTALDACCACGGGEAVSDEEIARNLRTIPKTCVDNPKGWKNKKGSSCSWYAVEDRCNTLGWAYKNNGATARTACCACNGGKMVSFKARIKALNKANGKTKTLKINAKVNKNLPGDLFNAAHPTPTPYPKTSSPTISPANEATRAPSPGPTSQPTTAPTLQPTPLPTSEPTKLPTRSPTLEPTRIPKNKNKIDNAQPTPKSYLETSSPTISPANEAARAPSPGPTSQPTMAPTLQPTPLPTSEPTKSPTRSPTLEPTRVPKKKEPVSFKSLPLAPPVDYGARGTGKICSDNSECKSKTCRNGACMATPDCYPVKHEHGTSFDSDAVNLVFVASGFDSSTHEAWRDEVTKTYHHFRKFKMFGESVKKLNVFLVDTPQLEKSFCESNCAGFDGLMCCNTAIAESISRQCFSVGASMHTIVVHNSKHYGGGGYRDQNIVTISTHASGPLIAIHELGKSLFGLADESPGGDGTDRDPNCDATSSCQRWADLIENPPEGYGNVSCIPGCKGGNFFVSGQPFMQSTGDPVGAVNDLFSCCAYRALTGEFPEYCHAFDSSPNYLYNYCKNNDYQRYGAAMYDSGSILHIKAQSAEDTLAPDEDANYVYVTKPMLVKLTPRKNGEAVSKEEPIQLQPGMYRTTQVHGNFRNQKEALKNGGGSFLKVKITFSIGRSQNIFLNLNTTIDIPTPPHPGGQAVQRSISMLSNSIELVIEASGRNIKKVRTTVVREEEETSRR